MKQIATDTNAVFLAPGEYVDSHHPALRDKALELTAGVADPSQKARAIYYFVRDLYYHAAPFEDLESYRASSVLAAGHGYCVAKASVFVALCRAAGLPSRLLFADVTNHLSTPKLRERMGTDLFAWHGYGEVLLRGIWIKVSPTFNASLCKRLGVAPLEFDGESDAVLQSFDAGGRRFMSYDRRHGAFHDVPARFLAAEMPRLYPRASAAIRAGEFGSPG
jgi:transglutaminase-like putative cysteine protease